MWFHRIHLIVQSGTQIYASRKGALGLQAHGLVFKFWPLPLKVSSWQVIWEFFAREDNKWARRIRDCSLLKAAAFVLTCVRGNRVLLHETQNFSACFEKQRNVTAKRLMLVSSSCKRDFDYVGLPKTSLFTYTLPFIPGMRTPDILK